jgi:transposase
VKCTLKVGQKIQFSEVHFFMSKYTLEKKMETVKHYIEGNDGFGMTARRCGVTESVVRMWVAQFRRNGIDGLTRCNGTYTGQFKLNVLQYQQKNRLSDSDTACCFHVPNKGTISAWRKKYTAGGTELLFRDGRGRPGKMDGRKKQKKEAKPKTELERLQEENEYLRMENAILKKLRALALEDQKMSPQDSESEPQKS